MEITFMPRRRVHSVNFLERFKGKVSKVDRYGGIQAVLDGHSLRYDSIQVETSKQNHSKSNSRTIERLPSNNSSRVKSRVRQSLNVHELNGIRESRLQVKKQPVLRKNCKAVYNQDQKENMNASNLNQPSVFLPRLYNKIAYSKCSNRIKSRILRQKQVKDSQITTIRSRVLYRHNVLETLEKDN